MSNNEYKKYKNSLRKEFLYTCVYCGIREPELGGTTSFHIDHYRPKSKFPHLMSIYSNLLYACRDCNQYKGNYWPTPLQEILKQIVLNPRQDEVELHLNKSEFFWKGKTLQGKWNIDRFRLASKKRIIQREDRKKIEETIERLKLIQEKHRMKLEAVRSKAIEEEIDSLNLQIDVLTRRIIGPME